MQCIYEYGPSMKIQTKCKINQVKLITQLLHFKRLKNTYAIFDKYDIHPVIRWDSKDFVVMSKVKLRHAYVIIIIKGE